MAIVKRKAREFYSKQNTSCSRRETSSLQNGETSLGALHWGSRQLCAAGVPCRLWGRSTRVRVNRFSIPDRITHCRKRSNVARRVPVQDNQIRGEPRSDPPQTGRFSKFLGRRRGERGEDLAERHSRFGHQGVLVARIVVVHAADIGAK